MKMESLNSIIKCTISVVIFVLTVIWIVNMLSVKHINTATEFLNNYKNCVIVRKDNSTSNYILTIKNPYTQDIRYRIINVAVPSGLWYNYSIGDTIGRKKQLYFSQ